MTPELVSEYLDFIELRLRKRALEAIELVMEEEVDQALGCRTWERTEERVVSKNTNEPKTRAPGRFGL